MKRREYEQALAAFSGAIQKNSRYRLAYINRAKVYFHVGDYEKAVADCTKALQLAPNDSKTRQLRNAARIRLASKAKVPTEAVTPGSLDPDCDESVSVDFGCETDDQPQEAPVQNGGLTTKPARAYGMWVLFIGLPFAGLLLFAVRQFLFAPARSLTGALGCRR